MSSSNIDRKILRVGVQQKRKKALKKLLSEEINPGKITDSDI